MANSAPRGSIADSSSSRSQDNLSSGSRSASSQSLSNHSGTTTPTASILPSNSASSGDTRSKDATVPAACLACRSKHLKCDGQNPCARCVGSGSDCIYVASRRGYKGPRKNQPQNTNRSQVTSPPPASISSSGDGPNTPMLMDPGSAVSDALSTQRQSFSGAAGVPYATGAYPFDNLPPTNADLQLYRSYFPDNPASVSPTKQPVPPNLQTFPLADRCLDAFFYHFHASHPFVLPKPYLLALIGEPSLEPLLAAARWVGSLFIDAGNARQSLFHEAYRLVYEPQRLKDGFVVQAMVLLIVALDGNCENDKAREILRDAETLALQIGLNTGAFATLHGRSLPVMEESWRRTWWDLFIIDGIIAGVHHATNFLLYDVPVDVPLPCEELQFLSGNIPNPVTLQELENSDFSGVDRHFSSFAYRILCGRNLGRFMRTPPLQGPDDENISRIEALLTNWRLHLPQNKKDSLQKNGMLDEMMFQAHMIMHATSIMLHQPFSQLDTTLTQGITSGVPYQPVATREMFNTHTKHTVTSACAISEMITHRVPLLSHTQFFTCVVTLSSIVHLSKWAVFFVPHDDDDLRQQIRLNIGALNHLSTVWTAANRARNQVRAVARDIYQLKKQQQSNPQYWIGYSQQDMLNSMAADENIITEVENAEGLQHSQHGMSRGMQ
ncbi:C6 transcription factor [Cordyceps militaris]|uniref:C6 transcription factor n=1 Tax=Cordyceps militaris TaxID=73501 RepID=A0A2H4SH59_CORMI|nr:C6 transcription factor [Cordyceps militaris]